MHVLWEAPLFDQSLCAHIDCPSSSRTALPDASSPEPSHSHTLLLTSMADHVKLAHDCEKAISLLRTLSDPAAGNPPCTCSAECMCCIACLEPGALCARKYCRHNRLWPSLLRNLVYWLLAIPLVGSCPAMTAVASCQGLIMHQRYGIELLSFRAAAGGDPDKLITEWELRWSYGLVSVLTCCCGCRY